MEPWCGYVIVIRASPNTHKPIAPPQRSARHCDPGRPSAQRLTSTHTRTPASRAITAQGTHHAANQARNPATVPVFHPSSRHTRTTPSRSACDTDAAASSRMSRNANVQYNMTDQRPPEHLPEAATKTLYSSYGFANIVGIPTVKSPV